MEGYGDGTCVVSPDRVATPPTWMDTPDTGVVALGL
jgi:hypothetical protein